jgi:hypothetical protein
MAGRLPAPSDDSYDGSGPDIVKTGKGRQQFATTGFETG